MRARLSATGAAIATMLFGLWVHRGGLALRPDARDVAGDALWAAMLAFGVAAIAPATPILVRGAITFAICSAVEFSQLIHTPTLDAWRATTLGGLVLGSGFDPRDLAAYAGGIAAAMVLEWTVRFSTRRVQG